MKLKMWPELYPEDILAHRELYRYYADVSNEISLAISEVKTILNIDPSLLSYLQVLGDFYQQMVDSLHYYNHYAEHFPHNSESYLTIGRLYESKGKFKQAQEFYEKHPNLDPSSVDTMIRMGICYKYLKKYDKAINIREQALKIMPVSAESMYELALVYEEAGDKEKAVDYLMQALNIWKDADSEFIPAQKAQKKTGRTKTGLIIK
ncbi:MAG: tetratricopeptide repeat protein [bacterium]